MRILRQCKLDCSWKLVQILIGLFVEACADTDVMSFGTWATMVTPTWKLNEEIELRMNQVLRPTWKLNEEIELRMNQD